MSDKDIEPVNVPVDDELQQLQMEIELTAEDLSPEAIFSATDPTVSDVPVVLQAISRRSPSPTAYWQTHPDNDLWVKTPVVFDEDSTDREFYVLPPKVVPAIPPELVRTVTLVPYTTLEKRVGLWPIKHAQDPSKKTMWETTALEVCRKAQHGWVRKVNAGSHWDVAIGRQSDQPWWPEGFDRAMIFELGLKSNIVTSLKHPIVTRARGLT